jgi:FtsP/CotA-like multicopper oxidase with cupredoxin domain
MKTDKHKSNNRTKSDNDLSRRNFLRLGGLGLVAVEGMNMLGMPVLARTHTTLPAVPGTGSLPVNLPYKEYQFEVTEKEVNPDGTAITALTINGQIPGPEIRVTEGDLLRIVLKNGLKDQPVTIHSHGLILPSGMDGVPEISQRPVYPEEEFVYQYLVRQTGTYWYHSHYQLQEQMGLFGPLIIEPQREHLSYDHEYVIMINDWLHSDPYQIVPDLRKQGLKSMARMAGKMKMEKPDLADVSYPSFLLNGHGPGNPSEFKAKPGDLIRFRVINACASSYFYFMVDGCQLTVTHASGQPINPVPVDNILVASGERYDMLVRVKDSGSFGIRGVAQDGSTQALGILKTKGANSTVSKEIPKITGRGLNINDLISPVPTLPPEAPKRVYNLTLDGNMAKYVWMMGNQVYPKADPLIVKSGERVSIELVNTTPMYHPMHLHGHFFRVLGLKAGEAHAPLMDTVSVPPFKKIAFEFFTDNPGRWFFHCHNLYHLETGMAREIHYKV